MSEKMREKMNCEMLKFVRRCIAVGALAACSAVAWAAEDHPGFVDFSSLRGVVDSEPVVEVTLREPLLRLITQAIPEEDAEAVGFISRLLSVRLHVYEGIDGNVPRLAENMNEISGGLEQEGWERIVRVREDDDQVDIFLRFSEVEEVIYGIAVMVVSKSGEMVLANIAGDISFDDISSLGRRFDIDALADFDPEDVDR